MADYTSFSSAPFPTRPHSINTGYDMALADQIKRLAQQQQMEHEGVRIDQSRANLERYLGMTPGELAASRLKEKDSNLRADTPGFLEQMLAGESGKARQEVAKGDYDTQMVTSKVATDQSTNQLKQMTNTLDFMDKSWDVISAAEASGVPGASQQAYTKFRESLPPKDAARFPEIFDQRTAAGMKKLRENMVNSVAQMQKEQAEQKQQEAAGKWHKEVAGITGEYGLARERIQGANQVAAANARAKQKNQNALEALKNANKLDPEKAWTLTQIVQSDPEYDAPAKAFAAEVQRRVEPAYREKLRKMNLTLGPNGQILPLQNVSPPPSISQGSGGGPARIGTPENPIRLK